MKHTHTHTHTQGLEVEGWMDGELMEEVEWVE